MSRFAVACCMVRKVKSAEAAAIEAIRIVPSSDFMERAEEYWRAFHDVKPAPLFDWARYMLAGHTVECALKALLIMHGMTLDRLQEKYGHKLGKLLRRCQKHGLTVTGRVEDDIDDLSHVHQYALARYPEYDGLVTRGRSGREGAGIVAISELEASIESLLKVVRIGLAPVSLRSQ